LFKTLFFVEVFMYKVRRVRQPAVAGTFYSRQRVALSNHVMSMLAATKSGVDMPNGTPSGATAALGYAHLLSGRKTIKRVVLLGPAHRVPVRGLALPGVDAFSTPLGDVEIDQIAVAALTPLRQVVVSPAAHAQEHALEVQLPFLQSVLDDFKLVPLVVGDATPAEVAQVIEMLWGGSETLIVISSDLSHFLPYNKAQSVDHETVESILNLVGSVTHEQACGGTPINGLLLAAKHHQLRPHLLGLCNSGDTAGDKQRVVGYASFAFM
jgi:MEMO1 family protein